MAGEHRHRIIVAEDEPAARVLLTRQLRKAGHDVVACADGKEALEAIRREESCIVIADWMMPQMDGLELCRAVRELRRLNALRTVYFILLTAHSEQEMLVQGFKAGADDYLTKPYHRDELIARLRAGARVFDLQEQLHRRQLELKGANARMTVLNAKLEKLAKTDALTGIVNRRCLFERLGEAWGLAQRHDHPLGCVMFDADHFKKVNDTYGHAAGDEVLKRLAATCRDLLRGHDLLGRLGGEEFLVVCPETGPEGLAALGERIRAAVAALRVVLKGVAVPVTVSVGAAAKLPEHISPDDLIASADAMLYEAKAHGRNQVWVADTRECGHRLEVAAAGVQSAP